MKFMMVLFLFSVFAVESQEYPFSSSKAIKDIDNCFAGNLKNYSVLSDFYKKTDDIPRKWFEKLSNEGKLEKINSEIECKIFTYIVKGVEVEGVFVRKKNNKKELRPVVIYNRGGHNMLKPLDNWSFSKIFKILIPLAEEGYIIFASNYRGIDSFPDDFHGRAGRDEFGGDDIEDILALNEIIDGTTGADISRKAMIGASRGSIMTYKSIGRIPGLKTVIIKSGWVDLIADLKFRPQMENVYKRLIPGYENNKIEELKKRSFKYFNKNSLNGVSFLILHGDLDNRVSVRNAWDAKKIFEEQKLKHEIVIYKGDEHSLKNSKSEVSRKIKDWLSSEL